MKEEIIKKIKDFLIEKGIKDPSFDLSPNVYLEKGDYFTNVAMVYAKNLDKKPINLAEEIKNSLDNKNVKVTVAAPGFLNFFFDKEYFAQKIYRFEEFVNVLVL